MSPSQPSRLRRSRGFTLAEIAIALVIISLLTAGLIGAFRTSVERSTRGETNAVTEDARESLLMFAAIHGRLPCPASPDDELNPSSSIAGTERHPCDGSSATASRRGLIPWKTLGIRGQDAWGKFLRYEVAGVLSSTGFNLKNGEIMDVSGNTPSANQFSNISDGFVRLNEPKTIAFVVWSLGADGIDASSGDNDDVYAEYKCSSGQTPSEGGSSGPVSTGIKDGTCSEFDDMANWVSTFAFFGRLRETGKMPMISQAAPSTSSSSGGAGSQ